LNILLILGGALFLYALISKPEIVAILFFTIIIADINFELGMLPMNIRAAIGLALFARTIVAANGDLHPPFFTNPGVQLIIVFILYTVLITAMNDLITQQFIKQIGLTFIAVYNAYYYFFKKGNMSILKTSLILAGIICFSDLFYTYAVVGEFPVQRVFLQLMKMPVELDEAGNVLEVYNHNFFGQVCGMCFIFVLNEFINNRIKNKLLLLLLPIMGLGVLMSTSRSSLLAVIVLSLFLLIRELKHYSRAKRVYKIFAMMLVAFFMALFIFIFLQDYLHLSSEFLENITNRMVDEPIQVLNKALGENYNVQQLGAMDWREQASAVANEHFWRFSFTEQMFGIGSGGYLARHLGHLGLNPHNGPLLLVIEAGFVGLVFYFFLLGHVLRQSFMGSAISSCALATIFVIIYCLGQNEELTSSSTLIFVVTLIAETKMIAMQSEVDIEPQPETVL